MNAWRLFVYANSCTKNQDNSYFYKILGYLSTYVRAPLTLRNGYRSIVILVLLFVCLFCCFTSQVNSYGHCGTVSSPNHTFSWAGLNKRLTSNSCTYKHNTFACNWQQPFLNESAEGGEWPQKSFHDQSPRKYGAGPGSNSRPLDLQSDTHL